VLRRSAHPARPHAAARRRTDIPAGSRVTLPPVLGGRRTFVIDAAPRDAGNILPWSHLELILQ
jgi:hypothetical protein